MGFLKLSALWLLLLIPPLVLLYFLKLRRPRLAVPSLVLWQQVINDHRVNSPFQRFKRNILLLLQLLLLLLLVLAAMQPFLRGGPSASDRRPVLIDRSASMGALDDRGKTRLDLAKEQVGELIDRLGSNEEMALIAFGHTAQQMVEFTSNKRLLRSALDSIELEDVASDVTDALRMADALARTAQFDRVLLVTDGNLPQKIDFELPFELDYQKLPSAGGNMGITALNARRNSGGGWNVFVQVQSTKDHLGTAALELIQDGESRALEQVTPTSGGGQRFVFQITAEAATSIELRLRPDSFDTLAADNVAFIELAPLRPLDVYVPMDMNAYRNAVSAMRDVRLFPSTTGEEAPKQFDLIITDKRDQPADANWRTALFVGFVPTDLQEMIDIKEETTSIIDWRRTSPLLEHVELSDVVVIDQARLKKNVKESDLETLRYEVITYGRHGPLMLQRREGDRTSYTLLFHTDRSTLPYRVGFPIMVTNLVRSAMQEAGLLEVTGDRTGVLPAMAMTAGETYRIQGPASYDRKEKADDLGFVSGLPALRAGRYVISKGKQERAIGVSLLNADETSLASIDSLSLVEGAVAASTTQPETNRQLWWIIALLALLLLAVEWWFYQRKPGGWVVKAAQ